MKLKYTKYQIFFLMLIWVQSLVSCTDDYFPPPPQPVLPKETATLEAKYVTSAPNSITSSYWAKADYHRVTVSDMSTGNVYSDGLLNLTGTFYGKSSFNNGANPNVIMKAAYDNDNLYVLVEWTDSRIDASIASWLYNGPADPLKPGESATGWTSQRNNDKLSLAFEINSASSAAGNFSNVGCAASCHNNMMQPQAGTVDIWNWTLAQSEALGYAQDMVSSAASGLTFDAGTAFAIRNNIGSTDRSGPEYEWDGVVQDVTRPNGQASILDPAYFLLNKTPFIGDPALGELVYHDIVKGCSHCHGNEGQGGGDFGEGPSFTRPAVNRYSRQTFQDFASSLNHTGFSYFNQLTPVEKDNVIAFIRGFSGVPGYYLQQPTGSNIDIEAVSNVPLAKIESTASHTQYKVLLKRKLNTSNPDDVYFNLTANMNYVFGIALMDNDGKNHIGSKKEILTFLAK